MRRTGKRCMPALRGGRESASIAVHPRTKRELRKLAAAKNCSVSYLINWLIFSRWHFDFEELERP